MADHRRRFGTFRGDVLGEVRTSVRSLGRNPGFSLAVVATLALCIGANATLLSALYGLVFEPLPVENPERLVQLFNLREARNPDNLHSESSWNQYDDLRRRTDLFEGAALRTPAHGLIQGGASAARVRGQRVTAGFFELMGVQPVLGRFFEPEEADPGPGHVIVLSQTSWEDDYGADPDVVGSRIILDNDVAYTVIGVAPRSLEAFDPEARYTLPYTPRARDRDPGGGRYNAHGDDLWLRLKPGVGRSAAIQQIGAREREWFETIANDEGRRVFEAYEGRVRFDLPHPLARTLILAEGGSFLILLAGCFNILILLLCRANRKQPELSTRWAIGAKMSALRRLVLVEAGLLSGTAALLAGGIAVAGLATINGVLAALSPGTPSIRPNPALLAGTGVACVVILAGMSLVPLEVLNRTGLLRRSDGSPRTASRGGLSARLSRGMVIAQVAVAFVLLVGAGLLLNSFRNVLGVDPGFEATHVVEGRLDFATVQPFYPSRSDAGALKRRIVDAMAEIPGVEEVGLSMFPMFSRDMRSGGTGFLGTAGGGAPAGDHVVHIVSPDFFAAMGIPILDGRACAAGDVQEQVVVDELFVRRTLNGEDPVGFVLPEEAPGWPRYTILGVAGRANLRGLEQRDGQPILYRCDPVESGWWEYSVLLRLGGGGGSGVDASSAVAREMERTLREIDPRLALSYSGSLSDELDHMLTGRKAVTLLLAVLAGMAALLSAIGVYAVLANRVVERRREIGIRYALGARSPEIYRLVLADGLTTTAIGLVIGLVGAAVLGRFLETFLFDVAASDMLSYVAAVALFLAVAPAACLLPARSAARTDPVDSLRAD